MAEREPISKKIRFEIFKRDSFTCQYCGKKAPDVVLEIDHIKPVASGGDNSLLNLVTSCYDCNHGKGARELSDDSVITKQRDQLDTLQERREQIDMMIEWQQGLSDIDQYRLDKVLEIIGQWLGPGLELSVSITESIRRLIKKYSFQSVIEAIEIGRNQYLEYLNSTGYPSPQSLSLLLTKLPGICKAQKMYKDNPDLMDLYHARNLVCKRFSVPGDWRSAKVYEIIKEAYDSGEKPFNLLEWSKNASSLGNFENELRKVINRNNNNGK